MAHVLYSYYSMTNTEKWTDFKCKNLAKHAKVFYETECKDLGKMEYIKGNEWIAGNISYHLPERPKWIYNSSEIQMWNKDMKCLNYKWICNLTKKTRGYCSSLELWF